MGNQTRIVATAFVFVLAIGQTVRGLQGAKDRQTAEALVEEFERAGFSRQLDVGKQLVSLHDKQILGRLEPRLSDHDRHVRAISAFVFAGLGDPRGFDVIAGILSDRSPRPEGQGIPGGRWSLDKQIRADRYYAVHVLAGLADERAVDLLLPLLADSDVNYKAAWALGEIRNARAVKPLIEALGDSDALVRTSAIQALVKLRAKESLPHIRALLNDQAMPRAGDQVPVAATAKAAILELEREPGSVAAEAQVVL
jgi:HEAT repeat protein